MGFDLPGARAFGRVDHTPVHGCGLYAPTFTGVRADAEALLTQSGTSASRGPCSISAPDPSTKLREPWRVIRPHVDEAMLYAQSDAPRLPIRCTNEQESGEQQRFLTRWLDRPAGRRGGLVFLGAADDD